MGRSMEEDDRAAAARERARRRDVYEALPKIAAWRPTHDGAEQVMVVATKFGAMDTDGCGSLWGTSYFRTEDEALASALATAERLEASYAQAAQTIRRRLKPASSNGRAPAP